MNINESSDILNVIHSVNNVGKSSYGLGQICVSLAKNQFDLGLDTSIWSFSSKDDLNWASANHQLGIDKFHQINSSNQLKNILRTFQPSFIDKKSNVNIIHQHGIWAENSFITLSLKHKFNAKTVIAPHGSLSTLALENSNSKKRFALLTYEGLNMKRASALHATSSYEIDDFRRVGLKNPIAYIDNGIDIKEISKEGNGSKFKDKYNLPKDKQILLYLSRITPKKGLDMLLKAIKELEDNLKDWILVIVGNDEFNYQSEVERLLKELNLSDKVFIIEPQFGNAKYDVFDAADFFILPSYSEGSPMVVLDSLASGTPVITTKSSSWQDLNTFECGYWVDIDQKAIEKALVSITNLSKAELIVKGENAKQLIKDKYLWENSAKKTIELYNWLLNKSDLYKPDFIFLK